MSDADHSGTDPRPPLEEFIRLTREPGCSWGMADSDVVEICEYALRLESRLAAIRKEAIEGCARVAEEISEREDGKARELWRKQGEGRYRHASEVAEEIAGSIRALAGGRDG